MKLKAKKEYADIVNDSVTLVPIKGTKKHVRLRWVKPYTLERLTQVWIERDIASANIESGSEVMRDMAKEPYFAFKEAALLILNNDIKIRLFYPLYWRWLAHRYDETQIVDIISEGKKKLPLMAHFEIMAYSLDMRTDIKKMTTKEAEQYRAELLLATKPLSSKISRPTDNPAGGYFGGSAISDIGASSPAPR